MSAPAAAGAPPIVVKFMAKYYSPEKYASWRRQLPDGSPTWGRCVFTFDQACRTYDWLAVYDDLSPVRDERFSVRTEPLACPRAHTVLVTTEPPTIKDYGADFLAQFGLVLTSQEPWAVRAGTAVFRQAGLRWYYGMTGQERFSYDRMVAHPPEAKTALISTVCSTKQRGESTLHQARLRFTEQLERAMPELQRFGQGVRPIDDKADAIDAFRYHVAIENHVAPHYWTEKLSDAFLGLALPFYCGAPNAADYFPAESFIPIDVADFEGSLAIIRRAIAEGAWERRLPALREARRRVLEEHNLFASLAREIEARHDPARPAEAGARIASRRALKFQGVGHFVRALAEKLRRPRRPA